MQLKELVDSKNRWTKIALRSIYALGVCMLVVIYFFWRSNELVARNGGLYVLPLLGLLTIFLLVINWFSQLKVKEVFETMMMNQRILSVLAEDRRDMFQDFYHLDVKGYQVEEVFRHYNRFDLIEKYKLELFRIRRKMRKICGDESADSGAKKRAQDAHDEIATLAIWERIAHLEDLGQANTAPSELARQPEEVEVLFFTDLAVSRKD